MRNGHPVVPHPLLFEDLLHAVFVSFDHLADHLAADGTGLTAGELTVVAVLQIHADLGCCLHLELVHSLTGCGIDKMIAGVVTGHSIHLLSFDSGLDLPELIICRNRFDIHAMHLKNLTIRSCLVPNEKEYRNILWNVY